MLRALYAPLQLSGERVVVTDPRSSELTKYAANTMLAMRVSFMNELARLCHATGADIHAVRLGVGSDTRIGKRFLYAGPGYGGSCFPKDVQALFHLGRAHGVPMRMAEATHLANEEQAHFLASIVEQRGGHAEGPDDRLLGPRLQARDGRRPRVALAQARRRRSWPRARASSATTRRPGATSRRPWRRTAARVKVVDRDYDALDGAHALVLLTEWRSYRAPNFGEIRKRLRDADGGAPPIVVDARNVWRAERGRARRAALPGDRRAVARARLAPRRSRRRADRAGVVARILVTGRRRVHRLPRDARPARARRRRRRRRRLLATRPYPRAEKLRNEADLQAEFPRRRASSGRA